MPKIGPYTVERELGGGGMAVVHLVRDEAGKLFALKTLRPRHAHRVERLLLEGRIQTDLRHPNVVQVLAQIPVDGRPALVMEYVDGPNLDELLNDVQLTLAEIDALASGILQGVAAAHALGFVHRDVKPANVMLSVAPDRLTPRVADFGIAKVPDEAGGPGRTTRVGLGSPLYMSWEQREGEKAHRSMDVFALGAVLYELIEGRRAFRSEHEWFRLHRGRQFPRVARSDAPERMHEAVRRSLAPLADRVNDASELLGIWAPAEPEPFSAATLDAVAAWRRNQAARSDPATHLDGERWFTDRLTPAEEEHVEECARCRADRIRARAALETIDGLAETFTTQIVGSVAALDLHQRHEAIHLLCGATRDPDQIRRVAERFGLPDLEPGPPDTMWDAVFQALSFQRVDLMDVLLVLERVVRGR